MHRRALRLFQATVLVIGVSALPFATVMACSCAFLGYPEAIAQADIALIGTVTAAEERGPGGVDGLPEAAYAFDVERSTHALSEPFTVHAIVGDGANCGLQLAVGQRWLVIASAEGGRPQTNLCSGSSLYESLDEETRANVEAQLAVTTFTTSEDEAPVSLPGPVLVAFGGVLLIGLVSLFAFRRIGR